MIKFSFPHDPVVQRAVVLKFQRAQRVRDMLDGILDGMRIVVHRIDAPRIACIVVMHMRHSVQDRIPHVHIGTGHIDLGAECLLAVRKLAVLHAFKEIQILLYAAVSVRIIDAGFLERSAVLSHLLGCQVRDVGFSFFDQFDRDLIHLFKVVGGKKETVFIVRSEPCHVLFDGLHKFALLFGRIGIIEPQIKFAAVLLRHTVVQENTLGMSYMQIAVRFRGEARVNRCIHTFRQIFINFLLDKMTAHFLFG